MKKGSLGKIEALDIDNNRNWNKKSANKLEFKKVYHWERLKDDNSLMQSINNMKNDQNNILVQTQ
jgi:hypothetical protein